jgi:ADP-heptose:LPS heptosyltransferase
LRLLYLTSTRLGDAVLSTGLLAHLLDRHPGAEVTVACGPVPAPLFRAVPGLRRVLAVDKRPWAGHWLKLWSQCVTSTWDLVVDLRGSALAYLVAAQARRVLGKGRRTLHRVEELAALAPEAKAPPPPRLWFAADDLKTSAELVPAGRPVLALGPAANWRAKTWRAERFLDLAQRLTAPDGILPSAAVLVLGAESERADLAPILLGLPPGRIIDLVGRVDPLLAAACLKRAEVFVGNDSGLMHLAAAVGTPTIGLFGPSPVTHYRPWGDLTAVVRTPETPQELMADPAFDHRTSDTLMDSITVDMVESEVRTLRRRAQTRHGGD